MTWADIPFHPPARTLRQFAAIGAGLLVAVAAVQAAAFGRPGVAVALGGAAALVGVVGRVRPTALRPVFVGMMVVTFPVNWLVTRLILAALFYGVFTPLGVIFKVIGRDALDRRLRPDLDTYWAPKPAAADVRSYFRQS